jgi:multimeric flavodoxin WrbA
MLGDLAYTFCDGCLQCDDTGACHLNDDMKTAIETVKSADGLIIGSPTRWGLLSGELKSFLDRLNPLARPELLSGKKAIVFAVGQSDEDSEGAESVKLACASIATFCENADIEVIDKVCAFGCLEEHDVEDDSKVLQCCMDAARKLVQRK